MKKNPNPQGKGLVPILQGMQQHTRFLLVPPKQIDQVEMELFTSLFVLQSEIRFNAAVGQSYSMYVNAQGYRLSLIRPDEWHRKMDHRYVGRCELQPDRTWTMVLDSSAEEDEAFMAVIERQRAALHEKLEKAMKVEDVLPTFVPGLGYNGRVLAYILGKSLRGSMQLSGIATLTYQEAAGLLEHKETQEG